MAEDGFMSRWARRKNAAATGAPEVDPEEVAAAEAAARAAREEEAQAEAGRAAEVAAANRAAAEAVDLETIDETTDFTVFLKEGVPEALKHLALRKLWRSNPVFACVDGLNDYDGDFTTAGKALEKVSTRWQIGKGYEKAEEMLAKVAGEDGAPGDAAPEQEADDPVAEADGVTADAGSEAGMEPTADDAEAGDDAVPVAAAGKGAPEPEFAEEDEPRPRVSLRRRMALEDWGEG